MMTPVPTSCHDEARHGPTRMTSEAIRTAGPAPTNPSAAPIEALSEQASALPDATNLSVGHAAVQPHPDTLALLQRIAGPQRSQMLLALQRSHGNTAVQRMLAESET